MFYQHQKVICINDDFAPQLRKGAIYTVKQVFPVCLRRWGNIKGPMGALTVYEAEPYANCEGFYLGRFRPIVHRPTDIEVFHKILRKHTKVIRRKAHA